MFFVHLQHNGDAAKRNKEQIEDQVFGPSQFLQDATAGAGNIFAETGDGNDIGSKNYH